MRLLGHGNPRSPCAMPSISWSNVKLTAIGLWSSGSTFSGVMNHAFHHLAVRRTNLGLADARRTLPARMHSPNFKPFYGYFYFFNSLCGFILSCELPRYDLGATARKTIPATPMTHTVSETLQVPCKWLHSASWPSTSHKLRRQAGCDELTMIGSWARAHEAMVAFKLPV